MTKSQRKIYISIPSLQVLWGPLLRAKFYPIGITIRV